MAAGYIGKISAVVTANTSDLTKKLADAGQNTKRFSENLNRSISAAANSAQNSLQKIFTPLQRIERRLQTSLKVPGIDLPLDKIRAAVSLTEQINKPLARVASGFTGLSLEVQGSFLPALQRAQDQALLLNRRIEQTGNASEKSFSIATRTIDETAQALQRLSQAQSLSAQSLSGNELQFSNPLLFQTLNASAATTRKAAALPATSLADGAIAKSVQALKQYQQAAIQAQARLETLQLDPNVDPTLIDNQRNRLELLIETARRAQEEIAKVVEEEIAKVVEEDTVGQMSTTDPSGRPLQTRFSEAAAIEADRGRRNAREQDIRLAFASEDLTVLSNAEAQAIRAEEAVRDLRLEAVALGDSFDSVSNAQFFDANVLNRQQRELELLRSVIGRVSSDVRGPLAAAFSNYSAVVSTALENGEQGFEDNIVNIRRLRAEVIRLAAETGQVGSGRDITAAVNAAGRPRGGIGDVSRRNYDNIALAANQAAFAIDDFFSATGGLEFKLRAVQNNVTQLGFIVGGTTGLFAALAAAIGGQVIIGFAKLIGAIEDTEAVQKRLAIQTESLTSAYQSQAQAVNDLASAFERLAQRSTGGLNAQQRQLRQNFTDLEELRGLQEQARQDLVARIDPVALEARNQQNRAADRLDNATSIAESIVAARQLREAQAREQDRQSEIERRAQRLLVRGPTEEQLVARLQGQQQSLGRLRGQREFASGAGLGTANFDRQISQLEARRAVTAAAINLLRGENVQAAATDFLPLADIAEALQARASDVGAASISERVGQEILSVTALFEEAQNGSAETLDKLKKRIEEVSNLFTGDLSDSLDLMAERAERSAEALKEFEASASRGDSIRQSLRPPEEQLAQAIEDIRASFERDVINGTGRPGDINRIRGEQDAAFAAFADQQRRQAAPALFALQDAVANAVLQGPSRQALNAADISTQQGTAELNRLLRGDDPARDQNLLELQKQTNELVKLNATLGAAGVAD